MVAVADAISGKWTVTNVSLIAMATRIVHQDGTYPLTKPGPYHGICPCTRTVNVSHITEAYITVLVTRSSMAGYVIYTVSRIRIRRIYLPNYI
jgi:hypothetical protein